MSGFSKVTRLLKPLIEPVDTSKNDENFIEMFNEDFAGIGLQLQKEVDDTGFEIVERVSLKIKMISCYVSINMLLKYY